ncbi:MAG: carbohydrate ABC transporter permease [Clostridiales bacterium]|jgi:putative aldouronate transport system permease protein|nr:carbohydrate ABC transporter permease [Clostridiales bacterium]
MKSRRINGDSVFGFANYALLCAMLFVMLYPFWHVVMTSFSDIKALAETGNVGFLPKGLSLRGYRELLLYDRLPRYFANTFLYLALGTALRLFISAITGFAISVNRFFARKFVTIAMVVTMFVSGGLIPTYMLIRALNGFNTVWVMVVPAALDVYTCIVFKTFFQQLPGELKDASAIDGANDLVMLFRIVLPLSKALLATFAIFSIVGYWNEWFSALLYLRKAEMHPIQMFLRSLLVNMETMKSGASATSMNITGTEVLMNLKVVRSASIVVTTLPIVLIYPFFQKHFAKGIMVGSLKG